MSGDLQQSIELKDVTAQERAPGILNLTRNPISLLGALMALMGLAAVSFVFGLQLFGVDPGPYIGILAYLLFPGVLVTGLLLIPAGMGWEARRRAAAARRGEAPHPALRLDLGDPNHVRGVFIFGISTAIILGALGAAGYRGVEFTDSPTFCGELCHQVMAPQYEAYQRSPHAQVPCVTCHIGPGADWWAQAKLSGLAQVVAVAMDTYPRPIPAPIEDLRPARDTCEDCHWRERTYGLRLNEYKEYLPDKRNTPQTRALAFRVGAGGDQPTGVHWHTTAKLWYRSADEERQIIGWVRVEGPEGTEEWTNPSIPQDQLREPRLMDCVDCHNRTGHDFPTPEDLIDEALTAGRLDQTLPYLKRESLRLLFADYLSPDAASLQAMWQDGWFDQLRDFYKQNYPDVAMAKAEEINEAIHELEAITEEIIYPEMNVTWRTYTNNNGHVGPNGQEAGCFRCHTALASTETGALIPSPSCGFCHYDVPVELLE